MPTTKSRKTAWSYSRLTNFETCPKKFYHLNVAKDVKEKEGEQIRYGKLVHKALEERVGKGKKLPMQLMYLEPYAAMLADSKGEKLTEQQLCIDANFKPVDWFSKQAWCRAIIDLAVVNDRNAVIVDYKTGKIKDDFTQLRLAAAMLMLHDANVHKVEVCYLWTKEKQLTKGEVPVRRSDIKEVIMELAPRLKNYEKAHRIESFPARPGYLCKKYCPVVACPHHGQ